MKGPGFVCTVTPSASCCSVTLCSRGVVMTVPAIVRMNGMIFGMELMRRMESWKGERVRMKRKHVNVEGSSPLGQEANNVHF